MPQNQLFLLGHFVGRIRMFIEIENNKYFCILHQKKLRFFRSMKNFNSYLKEFGYQNQYFIIRKYNVPV